MIPVALPCPYLGLGPTDDGAAARGGERIALLVPDPKAGRLDP